MGIPPELALTLATVVEQGSLDAAARTLHISQPAVTQRIQALERAVGQVLLVRSRPVHATAAGEVLIRHARQVAHLERETMASLGFESAERAVISIAVNADSLATWLLPPLGVLADELGVAFDVRRADEDSTANLLADGTVAAAVTTRAAPVTGCTVTPLGTMRYTAVASPDFVSRWFDGGVTAAGLACAPVVDMDAMDDLQTRFLSAKGADPAAPPRHRIPGADEMVRAIELGLGWCVLPTLLRRRSDGLVDLGGPEVAVTLYWQQWRVRSEVLDRIAAEVAGAARRSLEG